MKICVVVSRIPWPLEKGDKLRAYHQLRFLAQRHEVHLFCLSDSKPSPEAVSHLKSITPHITVFQLSKLKIAFHMIAALFSRKPFQVHYFFDSAIAKRLKVAFEAIQPDVVYCQLVRCSEYVKHMHRYRKVLDYMDAFSAGQRRRAKGAPWYLVPFVKEEAKRLTAYEHLIFDYFESHCIISEQDRKLIYHPNNARIHVVPNGIDADFFQKSPDRLKDTHLLFTGNMSYPPNVEGAMRLANSILPLIHLKRPDVKVLIAGANPAASVRTLINDHVRVSGWLPDIRDAYYKSQIFVAPMVSGSGMQNKLLEAMCMEIPCVTTGLAALPLGITHGLNCLVGESDEEITNHILYLLENPIQAERMGSEGRRYAMTQFDWNRTVEVLEEECFLSSGD
jgi:sugar transferase (PEP-CTERM/EpsH1 system associated)